MGCIGLDFGNEHCRVGITRQGGVDILLNEESTRETPSMITFSDKERFIGAASASSAMRNLKNTVWQIKRLIGKKFKDPEVQADLKFLPCTVTEGRDGWPLMHVHYLGEHRTFRPTELLGMIFAHLKSIASTNARTPVSECVIGVPAFMSDVQRRAYLDAAAIAGLKPLKLLHETTAAALSYGLFKTDLPTNQEVYMVFVDVGHAHTQVAVAGFRKGQVRILAYAFDRCLGGRDFDEVLFDHFAAYFSTKYKMKIRSNQRACQRLRVACEKLKKILSANAEAPISIECLMDEKDVKGYMTREEFEKLSTPLLHRIRHACERAVADSELALDNIYAVEVIGSGSRIPAISRVLVSAFQKEPSRTLNASESVARGCALQGAMFSPTTSRVKQFQVSDYWLFPIALKWTGPAAVNGDEKTTSSDRPFLPNNIVFPSGISFPVTKFITFWSSAPTFEICAIYGDMTDLPESTPRLFATFTVGPMDYCEPEKARLKLAIHLNVHGVLTIPSAILIEHGEESEDVRVIEIATKELSHWELDKAVLKEYEMEFQDRVTEETKEVKNALEALVYDMRNKCNGKLQEYANEAERNDLLKRLQDTETWLYEEGGNETKGVYSAKLNDLKQHVSLLEERQAEEHAREVAITDMLNKIIELRSAATAKEDRLHKSYIDKVVHELHQAEQWLQEVLHRQDRLPRYKKPTVSASEIKSRTEAFERRCTSILYG